MCISAFNCNKHPYNNYKQAKKMFRKEKDTTVWQHSADTTQPIKSEKWGVLSFIMSLMLYRYDTNDVLGGFYHTL